MFGSDRWASKEQNNQICIQKTEVFVLSCWTCFLGIFPFVYIEKSTIYELLMNPQLSIFSFFRSQEMQFFFHKHVWSWELLTFRSEKNDPPFCIQTFSNTPLRTNSGKQRLNPRMSISIFRQSQQAFQLLSAWISSRGTWTTRRSLVQPAGPCVVPGIFVPRKAHIWKKNDILTFTVIHWKGVK